MRIIPILMSRTERKYSLLAQTWTYWGCSTFSLQSYKEFGEEFKVAVGSDRNDGPRLCSTGWWWAQAHGLKEGSQFSWAGCLSVKAWVWWVFSILTPVGERRGTRAQTVRFSWGLFMHKSKLKSLLFKVHDHWISDQRVWRPPRQATLHGSWFLFFKLWGFELGKIQPSFNADILGF